MEHPKAKGDRTTLVVMAALVNSGRPVLVPFGENTRYDLAIDEGHRLARVQCKTGRLRAGAVWFNTCSTYGHHKRPREPHRDYVGDVDYFGVWSPETAGVYLIPIEDVGSRRSAALRLDPPRNGQKRRIRMADDYRLGRVVVG